ncbi:hypothetical protein HC928_24165, partial [bacterium]|nr:hypothetical protein [bacterium]
AKGDEFQAFAGAVAQAILSHTPSDLEVALALPLNDGKTMDEVRREKVAKIGENITVRRFYRATTTDVQKGILGCYLHSNHRIGVVVTVAGGSAELAKDIAMHIAASKPICISGDQVPQEVLDKERDIYSAQAAESGLRRYLPCGRPQQHVQTGAARVRAQSATGAVQRSPLYRN